LLQICKLSEEDIAEQTCEETQVECSITGFSELVGTPSSGAGFQSVDVCVDMNGEATGSTCGTMHSEAVTDYELMWSEPE